MFPELCVKKWCAKLYQQHLCKTCNNSKFAIFKDGGQFLDILLTVLHQKSVADSEELVHSALSTLNNLSYHPTSNDGVFGEQQLEIAQGKLYLIS